MTATQAVYRLVVVEHPDRPPVLDCRLQTAGEVVAEFNGRAGTWRRVYYCGRLLLDSLVEGRERIGRSVLFGRLSLERTGT